MSLTIVITRDVEDRYRGLLSSAMLEAAPGVYVSRALSARSREALWKIMVDWHGQLRGGAITLIYADNSRDGGIAVQSLGSPPRQAVSLDGALLMHKG